MCLYSSVGLQACCGKAGVKDKFTIVSLPSEAALAEYNALISTPPSDAAKFALKLLSILFTCEELERSTCTKAEGRDLRDQHKLQAIKRKLPIIEACIHIICSFLQIKLTTCTLSTRMKMEDGRKLL